MIISYCFLKFGWGGTNRIISRRKTYLSFPQTWSLRWSQIIQIQQYFHDEVQQTASPLQKLFDTFFHIPVWNERLTDFEKATIRLPSLVGGRWRLQDLSTIHPLSSDHSRYIPIIQSGNGPVQVSPAIGQEWRLCWQHTVAVDAEQQICSGRSHGGGPMGRGPRNLLGFTGGAPTATSLKFAKHGWTPCIPNYYDCIQLWNPRTSAHPFLKVL